MPQPGRLDVHVNRPLTDMSIAFVQDDDSYVATRAFPVVPVAKQGNQYFVYTKADFLRSDAQRRAEASEPAVSGYGLTTQDYFCEEWALAHDIGDGERANSDEALRPDEDAAIMLTQDLLIRREVQWASAFFSTGVWDNNPTISTTWDNDASDPVADIRTQKRTILENTGKRANVLVLGAKTFDDLTDHPDLLDRIKHAAGPGNPAVANEAALAAVLGLERVMVATATRNTAAEGATESDDFIVAERSALLVHAADRPGLRMPSAGYVMSWTGLLGGRAAAPTIFTTRLNRGEFADRVIARMAFDMEVVAGSLGSFFNNAVAA